MKREDGYFCTCHAHLDKDFWFLPVGSCLRADKKCDENHDYSKKDKVKENNDHS